MDIEGAHSERKNLVVLSLMIILFYAAGGHLKEGADNVSFGFVNIAFDNHWVLVLFIWLTLWWFAFRFYQSTQGSYFLDLQNQLGNERNVFPSLMYAQSFGLNKKFPGYDDLRLYISQSEHEKRLLLNFGIIKNKSNMGKYQVEKKYIYRIVILAVLGQSLTRPFFGSYIMPFILFFWPIFHR